jgi:hypothetical protein
MRSCLFLIVGIIVLVVGAAFSLQAYMYWHVEDGGSRKAIYADAQTLLAHTPAKEDLEQYVSVPPNRWPKSIAALRPLSVGVRLDGIYIEMRQFFVEESGYFVLSKESHFDPSRRGDPSYKPLGDGVWWYHISG